MSFLLLPFLSSFWKLTRRAPIFYESCFLLSNISFLKTCSVSFWVYLLRGCHQVDDSQFILQKVNFLCHFPPTQTEPPSNHISVSREPFSHYFGYLAYPTHQLKNALRIKINISIDNLCLSSYIYFFSFWPKRSGHFW